MNMIGSGRTRGRKERRIALALSTILASGLAAPALAQSDDTTPPRQVIDSRGVDVASGQALVTAPSIRMADMGFADSWTGQIAHSVLDGRLTYFGGTSRRIMLNGKTRQFDPNGSGGFVPKDGDGSTLVYNSGTAIYVFTDTDGTQYEFARLDPDVLRWYLKKITRPDQTLIEYNYRIDEIPGCGRPACNDEIRVQSIVSSKGYMLKPEYASQVSDTSGFHAVASTKLIDRSVDYCDPNADQCTGLTQSWPTLTQSSSTSGGTTTTSITDEDSEVTTVDTGAYGVTAVDTPAEAGDEVTVTYSSGKVASITRQGVTHNYSYSTSGSTQTTTVTAPDSTTESYAVNTTTSRLTSATDATGKTTTYQYDSDGRLTRETMPEGNYTAYDYDSRGNLEEIRQVAKPGANPPADLVTTISYDTTCSVQVKCNKPNYIVDPRSQRTDYEYSSTHGGVTRILLPELPAISGGGTVRPEINYTYEAFYAQVKNSSGTLVNVGTPVYKVTEITTCATAATCAGTVNETKVVYAYGGTNKLVSSKTVKAGDNSVVSTESYTYDNKERIASIDGPLSGSDDTTYYFYWPKGEVRGVISPDPDGGSALKRRAVRYTYDAEGRPTITEIGTVTGTDLSALTGMTVLEKHEATYDNGRVIRQTRSVGSTTYSVQEMGYDGKGRLECFAERMWWSHPTQPGPCQLGSPVSDYGPDRITKYNYDNAGRVLKVQTAYGTSAQADEMTMTYSDNGKVLSLTDAEGNRTAHSYDRFDRLSKVNYPSLYVDGDISSSNYEEYVYDAASNITSLHLRGYQADNNQKIDYTYDAHNRLTLKELPGTEADVSYTYDYLGRMKSATQGSHSLAFSFDALGRLTKEEGPLGPVQSQYDAAGRRTQVSWPDAVTMTYEYFVTGELKRIRESGSTSLVDLAYDDHGRRTQLTRQGGNVTTAYGYDAVSRLTSLSHDPAGSTYDVTWAYSGYNPADQVRIVTRNNDQYALTATNTQKSYTVDGRNQLSAITTAPSTTETLGADVRGNLAGWGSKTYTYSAENRLLSGPDVTLSYDPLGRLYQTSGTTTTRFLWDGMNLVGEYDNVGTMQKRYVHGTGIDEPLVRYDSASIGSSPRRYYHTDERGSIVGVSKNNDGTMIEVDKYDEYGVPASANPGRFQYTGQIWIPELKMYYYKARMYAPEIGRFMQSDPIGYRSGMNLYAYVGNDPINMADPLGLCTPEDGWTGCDGPEIVSTGHRPRGMVNLVIEIIIPKPQPRQIGVSGGRPMPRQNCDAALNRTAAASASIGLPFDSSTRKALDSLGYGNDRMYLTDKAMNILKDFVRSNPGLISKSKVDLDNGYTKAKINFGAVGYGGTVNGKGTGSLGALLGRSIIFIDSKTGELAGVSNHFDYDSSNADWPLSWGMAAADLDITTNCPNRVASVLITGGVVP